jgi:hypothetical protein
VREGRGKLVRGEEQRTQLQLFYDRFKNIMVKLAGLQFLFSNEAKWNIKLFNRNKLLNNT